MGKVISLLIFCMSVTLLKAQVGVNTENPNAALDINGNLIIRTVDSVTELTDDYTILVRDHSVSGDSEVKSISSKHLLTNRTVYTASKTGDLGLLGIIISGQNWQKININGLSDTKIGDSSLFTDGVYTVPESGIYKVSYEVQLASGVNIDLLGGKSLGILKNDEIWEEKVFDAVRVAINLALVDVTLAAIPVTSTSIETLVEVEEGDTITFSINSGGVGLSLLEDSKMNIELYKISN